ncbi:tetratricopeptide repeat protein [Novipirellula caenicola]|uniref:Tetratricopeptide repeat protein n=1 Tax=Novipirellula caenicola TaxID=1536901 RepID=A0ABP9VYJ7_9BACT
MPLLIQGTAIVIRNDALDRCLPGGAADFVSIAPNAMSYSDDLLSQASFMSPLDAHRFAEQLELYGLDRTNEVVDFVMVHSHDQTAEPDNDWLVLFEYEGGLIATMRGSESRKIVAPKSWTPGEQPALQHLSGEEVQSRLEFVRREGKIDVYRDKETGQLLYHTRLHETDEEIYEQAVAVVWQHNRNPGDPPVDASRQEALRNAIGQLQHLIAKQPAAWGAHVMLGKAWFAVDELKRARDCLQRAADLEPDNTMVLKELAGICLEQADTKQACQVGEHAVAVSPDDPELLGNLAVAYLIDGQTAKAEKTIAHAKRIKPEDAVNQHIGNLVSDVIQGRRESPRTLQQMMSPAKPASWYDRARRWFGRSE